MDYLRRANELKDEITEMRRILHSNPELGMELPQTVDFVIAKLKEFGIENAKKLGGGVVASIGEGIRLYS